MNHYTLLSQLGPMRVYLSHIDVNESLRTKVGSFSNQEHHPMNTYEEMLYSEFPKIRSP